MSDFTESQPSDPGLREQVAAIVCAFVTNNPMSIDDLPRLITVTRQCLQAPLEGEASHRPPERPAVPVSKSVTHDHIVCLEDGKKFKSLKRHLSLLGMTPQQYREKWRLPADYPIVAPSYSARRSALAKSSGLGRKADQERGDGLEGTSSKGRNKSDALA